jgi:hypothetical protein
MQLAGSDVASIIRPLGNGRYEIQVSNTSGIGTLNGFTWTPPSSWTIRAITKTSGAECRLASTKKVVCTGRISAPQCLCTNTGGTVTVDLAVSVHTPKPEKDDHVTYGVVGAQLRITAMTAVPFLIPGTPQEEKRQHGV